MEETLTPPQVPVPPASPVAPQAPASPPAAVAAVVAPRPRVLSTEDLTRRLLDYLRVRLDRPDLAFATAPRRLLGGTEAAVLAFRLADGPPGLDGPLVLRRFRRNQSAERAAVEAGIHDAAGDAGVPTPRCVLHETRRELLGGAFVVLEHVEGRALLGNAAVEALDGGLRVRTVLRTVRDAPELWDRVPRLVADAALRVPAVDAASVEAAVRARGGAPEFLGLEARVQRIERRIARAGLAEALAPVFDWLEANRPPPPERRCLVHGDIGPTNLMVQDGRLVSILDWSKALLGEPEAEVGFLRVAMRTAALEGLGRWNRLLARPLAVVARRTGDHYAAERPLDPGRVRWYESLRAVSLLASIAKRTKRGRARRHLLDPRTATGALVHEVERLTGVRPHLRA